MMISDTKSCLKCIGKWGVGCGKQKVDH